MILVAGVDSSTQSCKVVSRDAVTGAVVRTGRAAHPDGTEVHPDAWWTALTEAIADAGGLTADVAAVSVGGQQRGMVCLGAAGTVVWPALLWNDTRAAVAAADLATEHCAPTCAEADGSVPVASVTITKLRWLATYDPASPPGRMRCAYRTTGLPGGSPAHPHGIVDHNQDDKIETHRNKTNALQRTASTSKVGRYVRLEHPIMARVGRPQRERRGSNSSSSPPTPRSTATGGWCA
jgi:hypothetical protein